IPAGSMAPWTPGASGAAARSDPRLRRPPNVRAPARRLYCLAMDIRGRSVLILGGYGLVGQAVARRLLEERPREMTLLSLKKEEAEEAVDGVRAEAGTVALHAAWGDVFAFADLKDRPRREVFADSGLRARII